MASMEGLKDLWGAWCPKCRKMRHYGHVYRTVGWPYCDCGKMYEWVHPDYGQGVLRVWDSMTVKKRC